MPVGPRPRGISNCGEAMAPAVRMTSAASTINRRRRFQLPPVTRLPVSSRRRTSTCALTVRVEVDGAQG